MTQNSRLGLDPLNQSAFGALLGMETDWRGPLVKLLRSDVPINSAVREELAASIEGSNFSGAQLVMKGHEANTRWTASLRDRQEWLAFGHTVAGIVSAAETVEAGLQDAEEKLGKPESYCKKAYYFHRRCIAWKKRARDERGIFAKMSEGELEWLFHYGSVLEKNENPKMLSSGDWERIHLGRLAAIQAETADLDWPKHQIANLQQVLYWLWMAYPPDKD